MLHFASALRADTTLTCVNLGYNEIGDEGPSTSPPPSLPTRH